MQLVTCRGVSRALRILYAVTGSPVRQDKGRPAEPFLVAALHTAQDSNDKFENMKDTVVATSKADALPRLHPKLLACNL